MFNDNPVSSDDGAGKKQKSTARTVLFCHQQRPFRRIRAGLQRVIHVEFDRVGGHSETRDFFHLQGHVGIQHGVGEDAALGQETTVLRRAPRAPDQDSSTRSGSLRPLQAADRRGSCQMPRPDESCSRRRQDLPSTVPRRPGRDWQSDPGNALRCGAPLDSRHTGCESTPSGCGPNRPASPVLQSLAPGACRNWCRDW